MSLNNTPMLRISGRNSAAVRDGHVPEGMWYLSYVDHTYVTFEGAIRVTIDTFQMKAMDWIVTPPVVSFDKNEPVYKAIQARGEKGERCLWGPEYALRIQDDDAEIEGILYLGNKSSRNLMSSIRIGGEYILIPQKRTHEKFVWYVPNILDAEVYDNL
jgi:hypothetical protein